MINNQPVQRVALYARVSGEEQKQGHNIDSQVAELKLFAASQSWPVVDAYQDEAWSGAALARPALDRLRDDAGKKLFDAVLINDVDRLARDVTHLGVIKRDLERAGVKVIFRKIPSENSPTHNLLVNILGSFAEFERELIMDRTRRGRRHKVETRQEFIGCIAPYGYRYIPAAAPDRTGQLIMNPEEAAVVQAMYRWVGEGASSVREITRRLSREGIRPRKGGLGWGRSSVLRIMRSSIYCGTWHYNKHQLSYPHHITPQNEARAKKSSSRLRAKEEWIPVALPESLKIVSVEQWQRVQQQLDRNRSFSPRNSRHQYLLSGLVRCGGCDSRYVGNPSHGRFEYRCIKRCKRIPLVGESILDPHVWGAVEQALNNPDIFIDAISEIDRPKSSPENLTVPLDAAISGLAAEEARVLEAYRLSILSPQQLAHELELIADRRRVLEKQRRDIEQPLQPARPVRTSVEEYCRQIRERLANLTFETKRDILRLLLRKIVYEGDQVRIVGVIPLQGSGGIATTGTYNRGHDLTNSGGIANTTIDTQERNPAMHAEFTLVGPIMRVSERAKAASRANLLKANAARRKL